MNSGTLNINLPELSPTRMATNVGTYGTASGRAPNTNDYDNDYNKESGNAVEEDNEGSDYVYDDDYYDYDYNEEEECEPEEDIDNIDDNNNNDDNSNNSNQDGASY